MTDGEKKDDASKVRDEVAQLASLEELSDGLVVVRSRTWLAAICVLVILGILFLWSIFGSIPIRVEGVGIFVNEKGLFSIQAKNHGVVHLSSWRVGDVVHKGDFLAEVFQPEDELRLQAAMDKVQLLEVDLQKLKNQIEIEHKAEVEATKRDIAAHEFTIQQITEDLPQLQKEVEERKKLQGEGLIPHSSVRDSEERLTAKQIYLETTQAQLATLKYNLSKSYRTEEFKAKEQQFIQAKQERDLLQLTKQYSRIVSPSDGTILEILVNDGDRVPAGEPLLWLEHIKDPADQELVFGFVPVDRSKRIRVGTQVHLEVATVTKDEYGEMLGIVKEVTPFPISPEAISKRIPNRALVQFLMGGGVAVTYLLIEPVPDTTTVSGYRWTTAEGPPFKILTGTVCHVRAVVERIRPLYYVIPSSWLRQEWNAEADVKARNEE